MKRSLAIFLVISLLSLFSLGACGGTEPPQSATPPEPHTPCHAPYTPKAPVLTAPDTTALAQAEQLFADAAKDTAFSFEQTDGGIRLTAYLGDGSTVVIPDQLDGHAVVALGDGLFRDNEQLTALFIPDTVTTIGQNLLTGCRAITHLRTPQLGARDTDSGFLAYFFGADTAIGKGFLIPSSLKVVILGERVSEIPDYAFYECSRLLSVKALSKLTSVGRFAFYGCLQLTTLDLAVESTLGDYAFAECAALTHLTLPPSLSMVGKGVLYNCTALQQLTFKAGNCIPFLGYLFGADTYNWNASHVPESLLSVTLSEGDVPDYAFYGCDGIRLISLGENCKSVGVRAFYGCATLQSIALPGGVVSLGDMALAHCSALASVTLPASLRTMGIQAFMNCTNLTEITLPDSLTALPPSTFANCCNLQTVTLGGGMCEIGAQAFRYCSSLATVSGGKSDMEIGDGNELLLACMK